MNNCCKDKRDNKVGGMFEERKSALTPVHETDCNKCGCCPCECPINQKECECPIRLMDLCVMFSGCDIRYTGIKEGDSMNDVIRKFDRAMEVLYKYASKVSEENEELKDRIIQLETNVKELQKPI